MSSWKSRTAARQRAAAAASRRSEARRRRWAAESRRLEGFRGTTVYHSARGVRTTERLTRYDSFGRRHTEVHTNWVERADLPASRREPISNAWAAASVGVIVVLWLFGVMPFGLMLFLSFLAWSILG